MCTGHMSSLIVSCRLHVRSRAALELQSHRAERIVPLKSMLPQRRSRRQRNAGKPCPGCGGMYILCTWQLL